MGRGAVANACHSIICFNDEKTGYLASNCPAPAACNICKSTIDLANKMSFSLDRFFSGKPSADTPFDPSHELPHDVETSLGLAWLTSGPASAEQLDHIQLYHMESDDTTNDQPPLSDEHLSTASEDGDEEVKILYTCLTLVLRTFHKPHCLPLLTTDKSLI